MKLVRLSCVECGVNALRDVRASLCWPCRKKRHQKRSWLAVKARRACDPGDAAKERARYTRWARENIAKRWPVSCAMCGTPIECLKGRRRTDAICRSCAREHKAASERERRVRSQKAA